MKKKDYFANGHWLSDLCDTCKHPWGKHGLKAPHKCTQYGDPNNWQVTVCVCAAFVSSTQEAGAMKNGEPSDSPSDAVSISPK